MKNEQERGQWIKILINSIFPVRPQNEISLYDPEMSKKFTETGRAILEEMTKQVKQR